MPSKKVLFIIHDLFQEDVHFPLGPAYLSAVLRQAGAEVEIYDMQAYHYTNQQLAEYLDNNEFCLINVGFLAAKFKDIVQPMLNIIAQHKKGAWLVLGGHAPSATPGWMLENTPADIICIGESEDTIIDLYNCKIGHRPFFLHLIKGIAFKNGIGGIEYTDIRKPVKDLDTIPWPAWDLFPMEKYSTSLKLWGMAPGDKAIPILTSRGCIGNCSFCHRLNKGMRLRSPRQISNEMNYLAETYHINYFMIQDELFTLSAKRLQAIKTELGYRNLNIKFTCNARVDTFSEEIAQMLKEMGCQFVNIGFESMDQNVLTKLGKKVTVAQNYEAAEICNKYNLAFGLNLIWGLPFDSAESLQGNVNFIKQYTTYDQLRNIRPVTPYMGTPLYDQAITEGKLTGPADFYNKFNNSDLITVNFLDNLSDEDAYSLLFVANKELIMDYQEHTDMTLEAAHALIDEFHTLYFEDHNYKFRGARHYTKSNDDYKKD